MKKLFKTIPLMFAVSLCFLCSCDDEEVTPPNDPNSYKDIEASQVKTHLITDVNISPYEKIFDVSPAYNEGHLPFATNVGSVDGLQNMIVGLDKSKTYLVYCHGDAPSIAGAEYLIANGFSNVHRLEGNYGAWDKVSFVDIEVTTVKSKIDAGDFEAVFDVSPYYNQGHIPGAINANAGGGGTALADLIADMDKTKTYLVYCHGNAPSFAGAQLMEDAGFMNVFRVEGNFGAWVDAGYDVEMVTVGSYTDVAASNIKMELVDDASISPYEAIFDVSPAFNQGHLPFATNAGGTNALEPMLDGLDKSKLYLVYCHSDGPSIAGAELMIENGFTNVHRLEGNYSAWDEISFVDVPVVTVKSKVDAGDYEAIFDVSPYYDQGHLPGAINANASGGGTALADLIADMDKTKSYLVYCHGDSPAIAGAQLMEDAGFKNVSRLEGNFGAWTGAGYEVE